MTPIQPETLLIDTGNTDVSIAIHRYPGNGPHVLLIHGISSSSADFNPVITGLAEFCQPMTLDLRGHGASGKPTSGYHYLDYVHDLNAVIAELQLVNPIVLGHSLGGIVTLMWASRNPDIPHALIIEDSPLHSGGDFREAFEGWLQLNALTHDVARAWYADKNPHWPEVLVRQRSFDMVNTARAAILELQTLSLSNEGLDTFEGLAEITSPLLFLQGDAETGSMVRTADLVSLRERLPHTQIELFKGAGHTIHRSHPEEWLKAVQKFIAGLEM